MKIEEDRKKKGRKKERKKRSSMLNPRFVDHIHCLVMDELPR